MKLIKNSAKGYIFGTCASLTVILLGIGVLSKMIVSGKISDSVSGYLLTVIVVLGVFIANIIAVKNSATGVLITIGIQTTMIVLLLLFSGLVFDGNFQNIGIRLVSVIVGTVFSYIFCRRNGGKSKKKKRRYS